MSDQTYQSPKVYPITIGIVVFVLFLILMCSLMNLIKTAGYTLMWLPEKLGVLQVAHKDEVTVIHMNDGPLSTVVFTRPGWYQIYTNDYDLLLASDSMASHGGTPWVNVRDPSGTLIDAVFIERGLRPYNSPFAKGRPVLAVQVIQPGAYRLRHPTKVADMSIVPDYTTGSEVNIYLFYVLQLGLVLLPFAYLIWKAQARSAQQVKSVKQLKRIRGEDFWKREVTRQKDGEPRPQPKTPTPGDKWW